jgi:hypothetical protein
LARQNELEEEEEDNDDDDDDDDDDDGGDELDLYRFVLQHL